MSNKISTVIFLTLVVFELIGNCVFMLK